MVELKFEPRFVIPECRAPSKNATWLPSCEASLMVTYLWSQRELFLFSSLVSWLPRPKMPLENTEAQRKEGQPELEIHSENAKAHFCQTFSPPPSLGKRVQQNFNSLVIAPLPELEGFFCCWSPSHTLNWCFYKTVILGLFGLVFYMALVFYYFSLFPGFRLIKGSVNHTSFAQNTFHEAWKQFSSCLPKIFRKKKKFPSV